MTTTNSTTAANRRSTHLLLFELLLVARLELSDVLTNESDVFSDLLLPPNRFARVFVALLLRFRVL